MFRPCIGINCYGRLILNRSMCSARRDRPGGMIIGIIRGFPKSELQQRLRKGDVNFRSDAFREHHLLHDLDEFRQFLSRKKCPAHQNNGIAHEGWLDQAADNADLQPSRRYFSQHHFQAGGPLADGFARPGHKFRIGFDLAVGKDQY